MLQNFTHISGDYLYYKYLYNLHQNILLVNNLHILKYNTNSSNKVNSLDTFNFGLDFEHFTTFRENCLKLVTSTVLTVLSWLFYDKDLFKNTKMGILVIMWKALSYS